MSIALLSEDYADSAPFRTRILAHLQEQKILHSESIASALLMIPREAFVPSFLHTDAPTLSASTPWSTIDATHADYLSQIYQDQSLVTHLDSHGIPDSSSSMPTVMVQMLEELEIKSNHTVLEIGTGTGYNAALIACLTQTCTTIDREPAYIEHMQQIIQRFHLETITARIADGMEGYPENAPYDRIIATASTPTIPQVWIKQLNRGGRLVCDLSGPLARAFLVLNKTQHGEVHGTFLPTLLNFMPLKSASLPDVHHFRLSTLAPREELQLTNDHTSLIQDLLDSRSFRWFLQWCRPHIKLQRLFPDGKEMLRLIAPDERSYVTLSRPTSQQMSTQWQGRLHANDDTHHSLWDDLIHVHECWKTAGQPEVEHYTLSLEHNRPTLHVGHLAFPLEAFK